MTTASGGATSPTGSGSWFKASNGLILTQFNTLGSSPAGPNLVGGGSQDNDTERQHCGSFR